MIKLEMFVIVLSSLFYFCNCGILPSSHLFEQTLITSLLNGYNKNIRPDDQVSVDIIATVQQIVDIDEKKQIMTSSSFISQTWYDERLSWTPNASNNNIQVLMLPVKSLWIPDTMILNSADANGYLTVSDSSMASIDNDGQVYMILPALTVRTRCSMIVQRFPFDKQMCPINLTSWSQGSNRIIYTENSSYVVDLSGYSEHPLWKLNQVDLVVIQAEDRAPFEYTYNAVISIQLFIQRKPVFFIVNGIFACFILNCVTLLAFSLPFSSQIGLCMTCFLTYSVYSSSFSSLFPQQSDYIMIITLYFLLSICWTLISMAWFIICNYYISKEEMPKSLEQFCGRLQKRLFCCFKKAKQDENIELAGMKASERISSIMIDIKDSILAQNIKSVRTDSTDNTNEGVKPKCDFCNRCSKCQTDFDKDKTKSKTKKEIEARCNALNYFVFFCVLILIFISNMALFLTMSK